MLKRGFNELRIDIDLLRNGSDTVDQTSETFAEATLLGMDDERPHSSIIVSFPDSGDRIVFEKLQSVNDHQSTYCVYYMRAVTRTHWEMVQGTQEYFGIFARQAAIRVLIKRALSQDPKQPINKD